MPPQIPHPANSGNVALFEMLGWAFLISAVIWLLIWRLLRPRAGTALNDPQRPVSRSSDSIGHPVPPPAPAPAPPAPGRVINIARAPRVAPSHPDTAPESPPKSLPEKTAPDPREPGEAPANQEAPSESAGATEVVASPLTPVSSAESAAIFAVELAAGTVREDDRYGIVFVSRPDSTDDLKKIKGIAKATESRLNQIGIYQYRQVALWSAPTVAEFSSLLPQFKDRIDRDDWVGQARKLHEEKFGKKH